MPTINLEPNWPNMRVHYETLLLEQCKNPLTPREEELLFNLNMLVQSVESTEAFLKEREFLGSLLAAVASRRATAIHAGERFQVLVWPEVKDGRSN